MIRAAAALALAGLLGACTPLVPIPQAPSSQLPDAVVVGIPATPLPPPTTPSIDNEPQVAVPPVIYPPTLPPSPPLPDELPAQTAPGGFLQTGQASWYGKPFHGRKTASGEVYNMYSLSAAHRTLKLPTKVKVTNLNNGKSCVVRVNDRGPYAKGRVMDLSYGAAQQLGMLQTGHAPIRIEALSASDTAIAVASSPSSSSPLPSSESSAATAPRWLEVDANNGLDPTSDLQLRLRALGLDVAEFVSFPSPEGDATLTVARIGPFPGFTELETARMKLESAGFSVTPSAD